MLKAYKYRIYPTVDQKVLLEKHFGSARFLYNRFLDYRQKQYALGNKVSYFDTQKILTTLKKEDDFIWLNECSSQALQMSLRNLDTAYTNFFRKSGAYPKFKSKRNALHSYTVPQNIVIKDTKVCFPKFTKGIKIKLHRNIPEYGITKRATISRVQDNYFISILVEDGIPIPKPHKAKNAVGLDMGLTHFTIASDGKKYINHKYTIKSQSKLSKLQKRLSKTTKGSSNRLKAIAKVQKVHTKIANQRADYIHKISNEITNQYDIICVETLNVKGMVLNKNLSKSISDVAWGKFLGQLQYKAEWKGKTVIKADKWFPSSQLCCVCGTNTGKKPLHIRKFDCPSCGTKEIDRDLNASINIRNYGLGTIDVRNTAGTVEIQACGVSSSGIMSLDVISYDILKQEAQSSLAVG
jgi:putative transposase